MQLNTKKCYQGIDYVRLTAQDHKPYGDWEGLLLPEFVSEEHAGRRVHNRWILNYYGRVGEHCFVGRNDQGCMVQVSGALANSLYGALGRAGGRCSRVDIQVTASAVPNPNEHLHSAYEEAKAMPRRRGNQEMIELRDTSEGAKMLTIGSRHSQTYARVYDKHKESKQETYAGMLRWEIECKEETARDLHVWLLADNMRTFTIKGIVANFFEKRGISLFWDEMELRELPKDLKRTKTDETKLGWIASQVSQTIRVLLEHGKYAETARALLHGCDDDVIISDMAAVLARADLRLSEKQDETP